MSQPGYPLLEQTRKSPGALEIAVLVLLALVSLVGLSGIFLSFIPNVDTGQMNLSMAPACLGIMVASLSSMAMIWFRPKPKPASAWLAMGLVLWFVGVNILGWGGFAALTPNEQSMVTNLGFTLGLCFVPGGFLALLGLALYGYDYRQARQSRVQAHQAVAVESGWAGKLQRAAEYRRHIIELIRQNQPSAWVEQLTPIPVRLEQWETRLRRLVGKLNSLEANSILQRDRRDVPAAITRLQRQLETETHPQLRAQLTETLGDLQTQQRQLDVLASLMRRIELEIEETLAEIGTIYSQLQLLGAKEVDSSRAKRLSHDVEEQAMRLSDLLTAMDEVYQDNQST